MTHERKPHTHTHTHTHLRIKPKALPIIHYSHISLDAQETKTERNLRLGPEGCVQDSSMSIEHNSDILPQPRGLYYPF